MVGARDDLAVTVGSQESGVVAKGAPFFLIRRKARTRAFVVGRSALGWRFCSGVGSPSAAICKWTAGSKEECNRVESESECDRTAGAECRWRRRRERLGRSGGSDFESTSRSCGAVRSDAGYRGETNASVTPVGVLVPVLFSLSLALYYLLDPQANFGRDRYLFKRTGLAASLQNRSSR